MVATRPPEPHQLVCMYCARAPLCGVTSAKGNPYLWNSLQVVSTVNVRSASVSVRPGVMFRLAWHHCEPGWDSNAMFDGTTNLPDQSAGQKLNEL